MKITEQKQIKLYSTKLKYCVKVQIETLDDVVVDRTVSFLALATQQAMLFPPVLTARDLTNEKKA